MRAVIPAVILAALTLPGASPAVEVPSVFTYQGQLTVSGVPADGTYDLELALFDAETGGNAVGTPVSVEAQPVIDGVFTASLDFGTGAFDGAERWLEIAVRTSGSGDPFTTLTPRHAVTATPYALNANRLEGLTLSEIQSAGVPNPLATSSWTVSGGAGSVELLLEADTDNSNESDNPSIRMTQDGGSVEAFLGFYNSNQFRIQGTAPGDVLRYLELQTNNGANLVTNCDLHVGGGADRHDAGTEFISINARSGAFGLNVTNATTLAETDLTINSASGEALRVAQNGNVGIGVQNPTERLHVNGTVRTNVVQIDGGSDFSERFEIAGDPEPGSVVVIDGANPGALALSTTPYDTRVAGAVSGAGGVSPGMLMGQTGSIADGEHAVALSGRVYVLADASRGAIAPGDLLTTSSTPGHAMRASDPARAHGATLGKAMTGLASGRGLVLVLVGLQ